MRNIHKCLFLLLLITGLISCEDESKDPTVAKVRDELTLGQALSEDQDLNLFYHALEKAKLMPTLSEAGPFTLFAPSNGAFVAFMGANGFDKLDDIPADTLESILKYHIAKGENRLSMLPVTIETLQGEKLHAALGVNKKLYVNGVAAGTNADRMLKNGVLHGIDEVLAIPVGNLMEKLKALDSIDNGMKFKVLQTAITKAGLSGDLTSSSFSGTLFAPDDAAFAASGITESTIKGMADGEVEKLLKFHLLENMMFSPELIDGRLYTLLGDAKSGTRGMDVRSKGGITLSGVSVRSPNYMATNGAIHVVKGVLEPSPYVTEVLRNSDNATAEFYATNEFSKAFDRASPEVVAKYQREDTTLHVFSPTNKAVKAYLTKIGKTKWADVPVTDVDAFILRHTYKYETSVKDAVGGTLTDGKGDAYFVTENKRGIFFNGTSGGANEAFTGGKFDTGGAGVKENPFLESVDLGDTLNIYNGKITAITVSLPMLTPVPKESISEQLAAKANYKLVAAALKKVALLSPTKRYTFFAVPNNVFSTKFTGLTTVEAIEKLNPDNLEDAKVISEMGDYLKQYVTEGIYFAVDFDADLPVLNIGGGTIRFVKKGANASIMDGLNDTSNLVDLSLKDVIGKNGVVHGISRKFVF